jgi:hypothetical protein
MSEIEVPEDSDPSASARHRQVKVFGERNTGTHALTNIIELNSASRCLPSVAKDVDPQSAKRIGSRFMTGRRREAIIDAIFARQDPLRSWKHRATNFDDVRPFEDVLVLFTVRHPASWLLSLWKHPYHALDRIPRDIGEFLDFPWRTVERDDLARRTLRPLDLYQEKLQANLALTQRLSAAAIAHRFVRFEDLILRQEAVFRDLAPDLVAPAPVFTEIRNSTKDPRKSLEFYASYYGEERWREELRGLEPRINQQVDWDSLRRFDYLPL